MRDRLARAACETLNRWCDARELKGASEGGRFGKHLQRPWQWDGLITEEEREQWVKWQACHRPRLAVEILQYRAHF